MSVLTGLYEEHAPVQAAYIGAHVFNPKRTASSLKDDEHYKVLPGMVLFVEQNAEHKFAHVTPHVQDLDESIKVYPFGVAHDPLFDGKMARQNPGTGDVISAIVSGCVTIYASSDCVVGDTIYVCIDKNTNDGNENRYQNLDWYKPPIFSKSGGENFAKLGTVVEQYPDSEGVVRVLLDIPGYDAEMTKYFAAADVEQGCAGAVDVAPQHPVYAQFVDSLPEKGVTAREGMTLARNGVPIEVEGDQFNSITCTHEKATVHAIVTDSVVSADQANAVVGMVAGVASISVGTNKKAVRLPVGCKHESTRVVARPDDYGEHYVVLRQGGCRDSVVTIDAELAVPVAPNETAFTLAASAAPKPTQNKRPSKRAKKTASADDFGVVV